MRSEVLNDLGDSAYDFMRVVWPAIQPRIGGGDLTPVEVIATEANAGPAAKELAHNLDVLAGIDGWHVSHAHGGMRGIASRIQWVDIDPTKRYGCWGTFTMRKERPNGQKTELEKRLNALDNARAGWLLPALTVHAYVTEPRRSGRLIAAAVVRTAEFLAYAKEHPCKKPRRNPADGVLFDWWKWDAIKAAGIQVSVVPRDDRKEEMKDWPEFVVGPQQELFPH